MKNSESLNLDLQAQMIEVAKKGNVGKLQELIQQGGDPFFEDELGNSTIKYIADSNPDEALYLTRDITNAAYKKD